MNFVFIGSIEKSSSKPLSMSRVYHDWIITGLGNIGLRVPSYQFRSRAEFAQADALAVNAMKVMPTWLLPGETPTITVQVSPEFKAIMSRLPN